MTSDAGAHRAHAPEDQEVEPTEADGRTADEPGADEPGANEPSADGPGADGPGADGPGADDEPGGGPGTTRIAAKVVERLAQRTVEGLDRAFGSSRHLLGVKVGSLDESTPARVNATVDGDLATVRVAMAVRWPNSVRQVTRQARQEITADVTRFTGLQVAQIDITVPELLGAEPSSGGESS